MIDSAEALFESVIPDYPLIGRGKVRDIYTTDEALVLVATDRISAFDSVLSPGIAGRGEILTRLSTFWFERFADRVPNHLLATDLAGIGGIDLPVEVSAIDSFASVTDAPCFASCFAVTKPMPELAPVTITRRPWRSCSTRLRPDLRPAPGGTGLRDPGRPGLRGLLPGVRGDLHLQRHRRRGPGPAPSLQAAPAHRLGTAAHGDRGPGRAGPADPGAAGGGPGL